MLKGFMGMVATMTGCRYIKTACCSARSLAKTMTAPFWHIHCTNKHVLYKYTYGEASILDLLVIFVPGTPHYNYTMLYFNPKL